MRRTREVVRDRFIDVNTPDAGMAYVTGSVLNTAGRALDRRLNEMADTVCEADPRTREQRRADALGALAGGADRLVCGCGSADCHAAARACTSNVVIHVVAEQASVAGNGIAPGLVLGAEGMISAEMVAELAATAKLQPLIAPADMPELRYTPSAKLAAFVRCRQPDLPCAGLRSPGHRLRSRSYDRLPRRWPDTRVKPEGSLSKASPAEDFRWLARQAAARRHRDLAPS